MPPRRRLEQPEDTSDNSVTQSAPAGLAEEQDSMLPPMRRSELDRIIDAAVQRALEAQQRRAEQSQPIPPASAPPVPPVQPTPVPVAVPEIPAEESVARKDKAKKDDDSTDEDEYLMDEKSKRIAALQKQADKAKIPPFRGSEPYEEAKRWINQMQDLVNDMRLSDKGKLKITTRYLQDKASEWWISLKEVHPKSKLTWELFLTEFHRRYFPQHAVDEAHRKWDQLVQGSMSPEDYHSQFMEYARLFPKVMEDSHYLGRKFLMGLNPELQMLVSDNRGQGTVDDLLISAIDKYRALQLAKQQSVPSLPRSGFKRKWSGSQGSASTFQRRRFDNPRSRPPSVPSQTRFNRNPRAPARPVRPQMSTASSNIQCYNCRQFGHYRSECPQPQKPSFGRAVSTPTV